jgi:hypothetical protein
MQYLLTVSSDLSLYWVPLNENTKRDYLQAGQTIEKDFIIEVNSPAELQTKGEAFIHRIIFNPVNRLN